MPVHPPASRGLSLDTIVEQLATAGPITAAALADLVGVAYSTITPKLRRLETDGRAHRVREPGGHTVWYATASPTDDGPPSDPIAEPAHAADEPAEKAGSPGHDRPHATDSTPPPTPDPADGGQRRLRRAKGSIGRDVLHVMCTRPDHPFRVAELAAALPGTSAGAIANALHKLVVEGSVTQESEKPASFRAA